jgi:uncharacterized protein (DUF983 family)
VNPPRTTAVSSQPGSHYLRLSTILKRRCPRCGEGAIFNGLFSMLEKCPVCGLEYERRSAGYFTGAMYVSYALAIPLISALTLVEYLFLPHWTLFRLVLLATAISVPLIPWVWQYSRVIWIHFDQWMDPEP